MNIKAVLKDIGLTDNEISVYTTLLSLGPTTVQILSRKAKVPRATTYSVLEVLASRGLATKYKDGVKTLVIAEPPQSLFNIIKAQEETLNKKRFDIEQVLPHLQALHKKGPDESFVRFFSGKRGLLTMRQEILMYSTHKDIWYSILPLEPAYKLFGQMDFMLDSARQAKRIKLKSILVARSKREARKISTNSITKCRWLPSAVYSAPTGYTVYRDRVAFCSYSYPASGLIIESQPIADSLRASLQVMWQSLPSTHLSATSTKKQEQQLFKNIKLSV